MIKVVVSDPKTGRAYQLEPEESLEKGLFGIEIGDVVDGEALGLPGYKLEVTGGTDRAGFPMRFDVTGPRRTRVLLSGGPGFNPTRKGERSRKSVRGRSISKDIAQLNVKVLEWGEESIGEILGLDVEKEEGE